MKRMALSFAVFTALALSSTSYAQEAPKTPPAPTQAVVPAATPDQVAAFTADPNQILKDFANGGTPMSDRVASLMVANPALIDQFIELAKKGGKQQAEAIGLGIGKSYKQINTANKTDGTTISTKLAAAANDNLLTGYTLGVNDVQTASVGAGTGGGGFGGYLSSSDSSTGAHNGLGTGPTSASTSNHTNADTLKSGTLAASTIIYSGTSTTCVASVSPARSC